MAYEELKRVLDQVQPAPGREEAMLTALLGEERAENPKKTRNKLPRLAAVGVAAAVLLTTCAFAALTGLDRRILDYFGGTPETEPLLTPAAVAVDKTIKDQGSTLHVRQVVADRYSAVVLMDFTAPEGTVLDGDHYELWEKLRGGMTSDGEKVSAWGSEWTLVEDGDPADNRITLLLRVDFIDGDGKSLGADLTLEFEGLYSDAIRQNRVLQGNWKCKVTLPETDPGRYVTPETSVTIEGRPVTLLSLYVSPITVAWELDAEEQHAALEYLQKDEYWLKQVSLTLSDGRQVFPKELSYRVSGMSMRECRYCSRLPEIIDPTEAVSVTLFDQTFDWNS